MAYGTLLTDTIKSSTSGPVAFQNTSGTEVGTLCRAWVNFNGTGTVAIRGSFNVSSITDNGTGDYTVNFTNAMPDSNYAIAGLVGVSFGTTTTDVEAFGIKNVSTNNPLTTTSCRVQVSYGLNSGSAPYDVAYACVTVFR